MQDQIPEHVIPFVTWILISHNKPKYVCEAINSVYNQTFSDWRCIVVDSGVLYDSGYFDQQPAMKDARFTLIRSTETDEIKRTRILHSWCINKLFRDGLVKSEFVMYGCDDDWLYPDAFKSFFDFYQQNKDTEAMYGSMNFIAQRADGRQRTLRKIVANVDRGKFCGGPSLDCQVDGGQICHKVSLLKKIPGEEYWPEDLAWHRHADGGILEKIGSLAAIKAVNVDVGVNRKVPESVNSAGVA